jgi:hypothetical protein
MTFLELSQFQLKCGLSDEVMMHLLRARALPLQVDSERGLLIGVTPETLAHLIQALERRIAAHETSALALLDEQVASLIHEALDRVTTEALAIISGSAQPNVS